MTPNLGRAGSTGFRPARQGDLGLLDLDALFAPQEAATATADPRTALAAATPVLSATARIATIGGPVAAQALVPGDRVLTRDAGYVEVAFVAAAPFGMGALTLAAGMIGNATPLSLSADQAILLCRADLVPLFGTREVLVPARALARLPGAVPCGDGAGVTLTLATGEVVLADGTPVLSGCERGAAPRYPLLSGREAEVALRIALPGLLPGAGRHRAAA